MDKLPKWSCITEVQLYEFYFSHGKQKSSEHSLTCYRGNIGRDENKATSEIVYRLGNICLAIVPFKSYFIKSIPIEFK